MEHTYDFIANSSDGVFAVDRDQRIVLWNEAASRLLGHSAQEVAGRACWSVLCGRDGDASEVCRLDCAAIVAARRLRLIPSVDLDVRTRDGRELWINVTRIVVPTRTERLDALVHLFRPVQRQHRLTELVSDFAALVTEVVEEPVADPSPATAEPSPVEELTSRELEVLRLLRTGRPKAAIAEALCISPRTVRNHVTHILAKLGVHSRLEAVTCAMRHRLLR